MSTHSVLPSASDNELLVRTLTCMLAALPPADLGSCPPDTAVVRGESDFDAFAPSTLTGRSCWLKLLNHLARLLVREHEIVAALPKRSGADADVNIMVTTDYNTHRTEPVKESTTRAEASYPVTQNPQGVSRPRHQLQHPSSDDALAVLKTVDNITDLFEYLMLYSDVSFATHVASANILFNKIILTQGRSKRSSIALIQRYITFRSAPKMLCRFRSPSFKSLVGALSTLTLKDVSAAATYHIHVARPTPLTPKERTLVRTITGFNGFPRHICRNVIQESETRSRMRYTASSAWEYHQILLFTLRKTEESIAGLVESLVEGRPPTNSNIPTPSTTILAQLERAEKWTDLLHQIAHESSVFNYHVGGLEALLQHRLTGTVHESTDNDEDGGLSDIALDLDASTTQGSGQRAQQALWLVSSFQEAIHTIVKMLPKTPISLTFIEPYGERSMKMADWKYVLGRIFPRTTTGITKEQAIEALQDYGEVHRGKALLFTPLGSEKFVFRGTYHAESMLGILAYLSHHPHPHPHTAPLLPLFRHTYNTIGVSKRCCPVCTKLLTLLSPHRSQSHSTMQTGFTVLNGHRNIYPTALPPYMPGEVVEEMVEWLEGLLRGVVESVVQRYKPRRRESVESAGSGHCGEGGVVCRSEEPTGYGPVREGIAGEKGGIEEEGDERVEEQVSGSWSEGW